MREFNRGKGGKRFGSSSGRFGKKNTTSFSDFRKFGRSSDSSGGMHSVVCDGCKKTCEVPFKPTGNKPVYCNTCFRKQDGGFSREGSFDRRSSRRSERSDFRKPRDESFEGGAHDAVCDTCGKDCQVPFKPTEGKPVYCNSCFKPKGPEHLPAGQSNVNVDKLAQDIEEIKEKLDKIMQALELE